MNEQNPFEGYDAGRRSYSADDLGYPQSSGTGWLKNPVVAVLVLLVTAGLFALVISMSLSGSGDDKVLPVVRADHSPVKEAPEDRGGMDVPHQDSTVFAQLGGTDAEGMKPRVEDLFADSASAAEEAASDAAAVLDAVMPSADDLDKAKEEAAAKVAAKEKPKDLHPAGSSPETLAFVKSALEDSKKKEVKPAEKPKMVANTEPAAGTATGTHFVQMASVKDEARAAGEWGKLQKKYPALQGTSYRVQRKDLGEKGIFYRIQAGPFSKDKAAVICETVKAASGGCFLVTK